MAESNKNITTKNAVFIFLPLLVAFLIQCVTVAVDIVCIFVKNMFSSQINSVESTVGSIMENDFNQPMNSAYITLAQYSFYLIVFGIWYFRAFCKKKEEITFHEVVSSSVSNVFENSCMNNTITKKITLVFTLIFAGISAQFFVDSILALVRPLFVEAFSNYDAMVEKVTGASASFVMYFALFFISPIAEEFLFRGLVLNYTKRLLPSCFAVMFQAVLFAVYHGNVIQGLYALVLGALLGFMTLKSKSLLPGILFHMSLNTAIMLVPNSLFETTLKSCLTCAVSFLILALCCFLFFRKPVTKK